jgi:nitrogenase molybdenum-iron protein alpha/beta subunit
VPGGFSRVSEYQGLDEATNALTRKLVGKSQQIFSIDHRGSAIFIFAL